MLGGFDALDTKYHSSVEQLMCELRLPDMTSRRTGFAAGFGPDGSIYVAGGSTNGESMLKTCERLDVREPAWSQLPSMQQEHGYCSGYMGPNGMFFVGCGHTHGSGEPAALEVLDTRMLKWRTTLPPPRRELLHSPAVAMCTSSMLGLK